MNKSIYEEALEKINIEFDAWERSEKLEVIEIIEEALEQAQKQERLLELYKQITLLWERRYEYTNSVGERQKLWKIVKELENE